MWPGLLSRARWVFITVAPDGNLALTTKPNQDTTLMDGQRVLLGNDVWEHADYVKYQNRRADYLKAGGSTSTGARSRRAMPPPRPAR